MRLLDRILQNWRVSIALKYIRSGDRVMDIGCADGVLFKRLGPRLKFGMGYDPTLTEPMIGPNYQLLPQAFPGSLAGSEEFDAITMLAVLEHVPMEMQGELVLNCYHFLRRGGLLIITVPSPAVDPILRFLQSLGLIDGMSLEEHYGFRVEQTPALFSAQSGFLCLAHRRFQLGLNNLFVFRKEFEVGRQHAL